MSYFEKISFVYAAPVQCAIKIGSISHGAIAHYVSHVEFIYRDYVKVLTMLAFSCKMKTPTLSDDFL